MCVIISLTNKNIMFIRQVVNHVFLGNPEVGMYVARSNHPGSNVYVKNANHLCWDGYSPSIHNIVVLDNFIADPNNGDVTAGYLLQLATGMPIELNQLNSGRHIPASFTTLIITTSVPFENWFDNWIRVDPNTRRLLAKCLSIELMEDMRVHRHRYVPKLCDAPVKPHVSAAHHRQRFLSLEPKTLSYD